MVMGWLWDYYGMIMGLIWDDYMGWLYRMIMGLLWDDYGIIMGLYTHPLPLEISGGGTPTHFLKLFQFQPPLSVLEGFQAQLLFNFFRT